jgi:superfamily II DNA/RNA helicase
MDIFATHKDITRDYRDYINSFILIEDEKIRETVQSELESGKLWPEPLIQFNPAFRKAGRIDSLTETMGLHPGLADAFSGFHLFEHQVAAIRHGVKEQDFVVTSGTGSGKSLTYVASILHHLLSNPVAEGIQAVIVYPMNALINSQREALEGFAESYRKHAGSEFPIRFAQYTGQEKQEKRDAVKARPPHILLTNYMMLELILTRIGEKTIREAIFEKLRFLVFDELHTYRGRQGADVALLIRRILSQCSRPVTCIGTSATMISGGTLQEQKDRIAEVASRFFGKAINSNQVITETLERSISGQGIPDSAALRQAINAPVPETQDPDALAKHPVLAWLESRVALAEKDGDLVRRHPLQPTEIAQQLADDSGCALEICKAHLLDLLQRLSVANAAATQSGRKSAVLLPFKLHQFFAQTGSVWATLDPAEDRTVILDPYVREITENGAVKPLYPIVFSRTSGYAFACVRLQPNGHLTPREFLDIEGVDEDTPADSVEHDGYLLGSEVWSEADCEAMPAAWIRETRDGRIVPKSDKEDRFPQKVWFTEAGHWSDKPQSGWQQGWFMSAPLLFDPSSGTDFAAQTREANKLTSLGMEGRSTSTTITCFSILDRLAQHNCAEQFQKVLSFTDNRQDAALQAGHFNDFIKVVRVRAAIARAVAEAPGRVLDINSIGDAIFKTLNLSFSEFANSKTDNPLHATRVQYEDTFRKHLTCLALYDLRRSWRIVLPNLEQCALLQVEYRNLDEMAAHAWAEVPEMQALNEGQRRELLHGILDAFRLGYALSSRNYLDDSIRREIEGGIRERLRSPWTLEHDDKLMQPYAFCLGSQETQRAKQYVKLIGPRSLLGKFVNQFFRDKTGSRFDKEAYMTFMGRVLAVLEANLFLESRELAKRNAPPSQLYWLKADAIVWKPGDGETPLVDRLKFRSYKGVVALPPNPFFQRLYRYDFQSRKALRGDEHTGQLNNDMRQQREHEFKEGMISALFCSPTMELGIDINLLSIVHMRNVPPSPANYAQRAGRAGRNGQAALIFNFCSSHSPHDRHYFREQRALVAGTVSPPRLDLCNEELLRSHLHAMVLAEIGLATLSDERTSSLASLVNMEDASRMPLLPEIVERLRLNPGQASRIRTRFLKATESFRPQLESQAGHWFSEAWVDRTLGCLAESLDEAMQRWRELFRSARKLLAEATSELAGGTMTPRSEAYRKVEREQRLAHTQISQLRNDPGPGGSRQMSEFYPYRYLAAEAWLPGYNFTRLPLRAFVETQDGGGEYLSRPRTIALREYGPLNTIYHAGRKYKVSQLTSQSVEASLFGGAISRKAGYFLPPEQKNLEICPFSGAALSEAGNKDIVQDLLEMGESRALPQHRITCEEEERLARGYDLQTYFSVDGDHMDRIRKTRLLSGGEPLLNLRFIPAARLRMINYGWRSRSKGEGFPIVLNTGVWKLKMAEFKPDDPNPPAPMHLVKLTTSDTADALYIEPMRALGLDANGVLTLQYALLRGISRVFDVESSEIGSEALGAAEAPNILLYEAAEGSLGVLSQFVGDPSVINRVIQAAIAILRYDDATYTGPASYDDLLSYYNQRDHDKLDRFLIRDSLDRLLSCQIEIAGSDANETYEEQYQRLCATLDPASTLERTFVDALHQRNLRLPDSAQKQVPGLYCQPDFHYEPNTWVFIDGTPHDKPQVRERDTELRQRMRAMGHDVLVYHYRDDMDALLASRPDIFRKVRA